MKRGPAQFCQVLELAPTPEHRALLWLRLAVDVPIVDLVRTRRGDVSLDPPQIVWRPPGPKRPRIYRIRPGFAKQVLEQLGDWCDRVKQPDWLFPTLHAMRPGSMAGVWRRAKLAAGWTPSRRWSTSRSSILSWLRYSRTAPDFRQHERSRPEVTCQPLRLMVRWANACLPVLVHDEVQPRMEYLLLEDIVDCEEVAPEDRRRRLVRLVSDSGCANLAELEQHVERLLSQSTDQSPDRPVLETLLASLADWPLEKSRSVPQPTRLAMDVQVEPVLDLDPAMVATLREDIEADPEAGVALGERLGNLVFSYPALQRHLDGDLSALRKERERCLQRLRRQARALLEAIMALPPSARRLIAAFGFSAQNQKQLALGAVSSWVSGGGGFPDDRDWSPRHSPISDLLEELAMACERSNLAQRKACPSSAGAHSSSAIRKRVATLLQRVERLLVEFELLSQELATHLAKSGFSGTEQQLAAIGECPEVAPNEQVIQRAQSLRSQPEDNSGWTADDCPIRRVLVRLDAASKKGTSTLSPVPTRTTTKSRDVMACLLAAVFNEFNGLARPTDDVAKSPYAADRVEEQVTDEQTQLERDKEYRATRAGFVWTVFQEALGAVGSKEPPRWLIDVLRVSRMVNKV